LYRLVYRSKQRGFLELDLVLGTWVEQHVHAMDEPNIRALLQVLDLVSSPACGVGVGVADQSLFLCGVPGYLSVVETDSGVEELDNLHRNDQVIREG
jgi:hypothetical protein